MARAGTSLVAVIVWIIFIASFPGYLGGPNDTTVLVSLLVLFFLLLGGPFYLFGGDGLIKKIWNKDKLTLDEREALKFLRSFNLGRYSFTIMTLVKGLHTPCTADDGERLLLFKRIKDEVTRDVSSFSKICQKMVKARIWAIEDSRDLKECLDWFE